MLASGLLLLEHFNLNVASTSLAERFFVDGLMCCKDPFRAAKIKSMHVNVGPKCQFHTAGPEFEAYIATEGSQIWRGKVTVVYRDEETCKKAVDNCRALATSSEFSGSKLRVSSDLEDYREGVDLVCPFGNAIRVRVATPEELEGLGAQTGSRDGSEKSEALGIAGASLPCRPGTAAGIADFFLRNLGFPSEQTARGVRILGRCQFLDFEESADALPPYQGDHLCVYIADYQASLHAAPAPPSSLPRTSIPRTRLFRSAALRQAQLHRGGAPKLKLNSCFERLSEAGLVWVNPRFTHLDATANGEWEAACRYRQFRFKAMAGPDGEVLLEQEFEVRMVDHPSCPLAPSLRQPHQCLQPPTAGGS